ncbi:AsmA family protein [Sphingobacterium corticibacterium]|uniref:DUF748 domain-containing protein n=1 Tax=Sphingobacterium corticibacterium TaxID=2484746 RepID=A0A4Q6XR73_9SPHI|nr:hypothetical protein [Sphingobacterium corticibacterium]RZF58967.1 hypothetical protein EWE74_16760 [Sphingobacterium corticibacterium]
MKPIWKWVIGILVLIVVALAGVSWYLSRNWKPIVEEQLQELVKSSTDSLYRLTYEDLDMTVALGNVTLKNVLLKPDTQVYARMEAAELAPDNLYDIEIKELKVKRFGILNMLRNRELHIKSIDLTEPRIHLTNKYHAYNDTIATEKPKKSLYESIKGVLNAVNIGRIDIERAAFRLTKLNEDSVSTNFGLDSLQIRAEDILIDEHAQADTSRLYYTKLIEAFIPGFEYTFSDGFYKARFEALQINTQAQTLLLTQVDFRPALDKAAFYKKHGKNVTRADLHFDTLYMEKLDFKKLIEEQQTIAQRVSVKNGHATLYGDKRYPKQPVNQIGQAPHQKLMRVKKRISVDTVFVKNIDVVYGEMSGKYHREGEISFNGATGTITNVTNDTVILSQDKYMRADLRAKVMGRGNLHAKFTFDMLSKTGEHTYNGTLGAMSATAFNRILDPLLNVGIRSGNIRGIRFNISGTDYRSRGDFHFDYDNLKIDLKADPGKPQKKRSLKIASFLVNQLIINDSNPDANEKYHVGSVNHRRVPEHTFFKNLWESLLDGIKQTAGISKEREQKWKERAEVAKEAVERTKETTQQTKGFFRGLFKKKEE